jgi:hypothetical protein
MARQRLVSINADLPNIESIVKQLERYDRDLPYTQEAVKTATEVIQRYWINAISGNTVYWSGGSFRIRVVSGSYLRSVAEGLRYPAGDNLTGEVVSLSPHANIIEEGIKPFDMKKTHLKGPKAIVGKNGKRYITVPFRHNVPGQSATADAMPKAVYAKAMQLAISRRNGLLVHWYSDKKYEWGDRLGKEDGGPQRPHWSTGKYTGMVKMSGKPHTQYMTFRRLSENSKPESWKHPGVRPRPVTQAVEEMARDEVIQLIRTGFEVDLLSLGF